MKIYGWKLCLAVTLLLLANTVRAELIDQGDGLIYDTVLDITWLQDANYAFTSGYDDDGNMTWYDAVEWADKLVYAGFDDWRLASRSISAGTPVGAIDLDSSPVNCHTESEEACRDNEYGYMFVYNLGGTLFDDLTGNQTSTSGVELQNIQYGHWTNTQYHEEYFGYTQASVFFFGGGGSLYDGKTSYWAAWAVRDGNINDPPCSTPEKPGELTAKVRHYTVNLSWDPIDTATSYDVYRSVDVSEFDWIDNIEQSSYEDTLRRGTEIVQYYIVAINECGGSIPSDREKVVLKKGYGQM